MRLKNWLIALTVSSCFFSKAQLQFVSNDTSNFLKIMLVGDLTINQNVLDASYNANQKQYDFQYIFHYNDVYCTPWQHIMTKCTR